MIKNIQTSKNCPKCGKKADLKRWNYKLFGEDKVKFSVQCRGCGIHSLVKGTAHEAISAWDKELFSQLQQRLSEPINIEKVNEDNCFKVVEAVVRKASNQFKLKYDLFLDIPEESENYSDFLKKIKKEEKDFCETLTYWGVTGDVESIIEKLKTDIKKGKMK